MPQLWIDLSGQPLFEQFDPLGYLLKPLGMALWITSALLICNNGDALTESGGELA